MKEWINWWSVAFSVLASGCTDARGVLWCVCGQYTHTDARPPVICLYPLLMPVNMRTQPGGWLNHLYHLTTYQFINLWSEWLKWFSVEVRISTGTVDFCAGSCGWVWSRSTVTACREWACWPALAVCGWDVYVRACVVTTPGDINFTLLFAFSEWYSHILLDSIFDRI